MNIGYYFAESIIIIEFALIAFIVFMTFFLRFYYYILNIRNKRITNEVENYFKKLMISRQKFQARDFKNRWKKIDLLLNVIDKLDKYYTPDRTGTIRTDFITTIMLPLARKAAVSRKWVQRFYAARTFGLIPGKNDDQLIEKLVNDPAPLVNIYADNAALINYSDAGINGMIQRMASETWLAKTLQLRTFDNLNGTERKYFEAKLSATNDPAVRTVCYEIMAKYPPEPFNWDIMPDIHSTHIPLKLAAMKFIYYVKNSKSVPLLIEQLNDPNWEVRLLAIHLLNESNDKEVIPHLTHCLNDPDWWVKLSAAETLKKLGPEGEKVLEKENPALKGISFNLNHQPNTWW